MSNYLKKLKQVIKGQVPISDIYHYAIGNLRNTIYYSPNPKYKWLIRPHIRAQIFYRITVAMNPLCYTQGACIKCGCDTPALQMANKACIGNCYPPMLLSSKDYTNHFIDHQNIYTSEDVIWVWSSSKKKFIKYEQSKSNKTHYVPAEVY